MAHFNSLRWVNLNIKIMKSYVRNMQITGLSISLLLFTLIGCDREQVEVLDDSTSINTSQLQASDESELILEEMINSY